ncbi:multisubunit potassium/proton antiporter PhaE subunit [Albidovulum inexpectatum]|uniref:Multisubunit potassium/proton antiporter PhaE subunit n=1 Tax=Albidovulum inexpectatum TaxID=196587 RepID=A0A2S5JH79_9RHOB|nr:Na+/H+ antiporter subunit E [Albidovulum inexpectatum]PPB80741.1 multisubunit potassium/proton antiporter PhaE subunit [Albidovulum inexpectatum]
MFDRIFPHPLLSLVLTATWVALVNSVSAGTVLMGAILGVAIPHVTKAYWPGRMRLRRPLLFAEYAVVVLWDIIVANFQVAAIILFRGRDSIRSAWIPVPLEIDEPEAITILAGTITMTPGTISAVLSADGRALLVHCLDTDDPGTVRDQIKARYERRLKEIFE